MDAEVCDGNLAGVRGHNRMNAPASPSDSSGQGPVWKNPAWIGAVAALLGVFVPLIIFLLTRNSTTQGPVSESASREKPEATTGSATGEDAEARIYDLATGVLVDRFEVILGPPLAVRDVATGYSETLWVTDDYSTQAVWNDKRNVVLYTVTTNSPEFNPELPYKLGANDSSLYLGRSTFADIRVEPNGFLAVYPANAKFTWSESYGAGYALDYRKLIVTHSWDGVGVEPADSDSRTFDLWREVVNACDFDAPAHTSAGVISQGGFGSCASSDTEAVATLGELRKRLVISGFTLTAPDFDLDILGGFYLYSPFYFDSRCDIPNGCR